MTEDPNHKITKIEKDIENFSEVNSKKKSDGLNGERVLAELIAGLLFGVFVGYQIDKYFNTKPLFLIILTILGLAGSFYNIYKQVSK